MADTIKKIAEVAGDYQGYALAARRKFIELRLQQDPEIRALYLRGARSIARKLKAQEFATPGAKLYKRQLEELEKVLRSEADVLKAGLAKHVDRYISAGAEAGGLFSKMVTIDVLDKAGLSKELPTTALFAQVNKRAIEACYARTHKGLYLSDRIWKAGENYRTAIRNIIQEAVATNQDVATTARMIEKYVKGGAKTLARDYPNMMERMPGRVPGDVSYEALRLARTEMTAAYGEGVIAAAEVSPSATGIKWVLSASHPVKDICDHHAQADEFGLGKGVYPIEEVPVYPAHPNELCHLQTVVEEPEDFVKKLKSWREDPTSQPEIEDWYNNIFKKAQGAGKSSGKSAKKEASAGAAKRRAPKRATAKAIELIDAPIAPDGAPFGETRGVAKTKEFIESALSLAESKGADFTGITITSSRYYDAAQPAHGFVQRDGRPFIYLTGTDVAEFALDNRRQLEGVYVAVGMDPALAERAGMAVEFTARTLLHELGHLKTMKLTGDYVGNGFDDRFREYIEHVGIARHYEFLDLEAYEIGEWIAEDYRLILDPDSPYPHKFAYLTDLQFPETGRRRRKALKEVLGL